MFQQCQPVSAGCACVQSAKSKVLEVLTVAFLVNLFNALPVQLEASFQAPTQQMSHPCCADGSRLSCGVGCMTTQASLQLLHDNMSSLLC